MRKQPMDGIRDPVQDPERSAGRPAPEDSPSMADEGWKAALEAIEDGVWVLDGARRVVYSNGVVERMLGVSVADVTGLPCRATAICRMQGWEDCLLDRMERAQSPVTREVAVPGKGYRIEVTASPIRSTRETAPAGVRHARCDAAARG